MTKKQTNRGETINVEQKTKQFHFKKNSIFVITTKKKVTNEFSFKKFEKRVPFLRFYFFKKK